MTYFQIGDHVTISDKGLFTQEDAYPGHEGVIIGFGVTSSVPDFIGDKQIKFSLVRVMLWEPREIVIAFPSELTIIDPVNPEMLRREINPSQAAEILNVQESYMEKLLEREDIPFHYSGHNGYEDTGATRLLWYTDVIAFRDKRSQEREEILRELTREFQHEYESNESQE